MTIAGACMERTDAWQRNLDAWANGETATRGLRDVLLSHVAQDLTGG